MAVPIPSLTWLSVAHLSCSGGAGVGGRAMAVPIPSLTWLSVAHLSCSGGAGV
ncbi:hypothetical protein [Streptomyces sp. P17]|uniref:hypothetical protein n=1 Tax=Streptomyces sp. P17 TaxID=3074716 RepID=UPI0028F43182|nr:hypothetical protein [Streptomyces sp. P17]MDT9700707.1 hypothetical protein [Streptomyces sp. P17]